MKITQVEIYAVELHKEGYNWHPVLIRIQTDDGISGVGEVGLAYGVGQDAGVGMVRNLAQSYLIGADPLRIDYLWDVMYRQTFWGQGGGPIVYGGISAIDEALWDIKGKAFGKPVYELLGGRFHGRLWVYANGWYRNANTPDEYAEYAQQVVSDGYRAMKFDPFAVRPDGVWDYPPRALTRERADLAFNRVAAVREAVGSQIEILVEVHGNLGVTAAIQMGKRFETLDPFFYEEPVDAMNIDSMRKVAENVNIPIAAGERLYTRYGFRQYIEQQVLDILQPDVGLAGGISETRKIATFAETYNLHVQPHNCASPVSTAAAIHVDAAMSNFIIQEMFPYRDQSNYELVNRAYELEVQQGYLSIPTEPGLGVELNDAALQDHACIVIT